MIRIENWSVISENDPYQAPECQEKRLHGEVYGHPRFPDGHLVTTSPLVLIDLKSRKAETTSGSQYELGEVSEGYAAYATDWL